MEIPFRITWHDGQDEGLKRRGVVTIGDQGLGTIFETGPFDDLRYSFVTGRFTLRMGAGHHSPQAAIVAMFEAMPMYALKEKFSRAMFLASGGEDGD